MVDIATIYLLGTAEKGPKNEPVQINSLDEFVQVFGTGGSLYNAYRFIQGSGYDGGNIYYVKVTGEEAVCIITPTNAPEDSEVYIKLQAYTTDERYNSFMVHVYYDYDAGDYCFSIKDMNEEEVYNYYFGDYQTVSALVEKINDDHINGIIFCDALFESSSDMNLTEFFQLSSDQPEVYYYFEGADSGLAVDKNTYYLYLQTTYELLEGHDIDYILPLDVFVDDTPEFYYTETSDKLDMFDDYEGEQASFYRQLLKFCYRQYTRGIMTHGIMNFNFISPDKVVQTETLNGIIPLMREFFENRNNFIVENQDVGYLTSLVWAYVPLDDVEVIPGSIPYVLTLVTTPYQDNPTNRTVYGCDKQVFEFPYQVICDFSSIGIVTFRTSVKYGLVVSSACTCMPQESDLYSYANLRQVQYVVNGIRHITDEFVGATGKISQLLLSIQLKCQQALDEYQRQGIIKKYTLDVKQRDNGIDIIVNIMPIYSIHFIKFSGGINL